MTISKTKQAYTGALNRNLDVKAQDLLTVGDFGVDTTGATNCTANLKAFFDAAILAGRGHIPAGTYKVTRSTLVFDNGFVETTFPWITTEAGVKFVVDSVTPGTVGPILAFTNGTASSGVGAYWKGGHLGSIRFEGLATTSLSDANTAEHGLQLRGVQGTSFGVMYGRQLGGAVVYAEEKLYGGTNPDPYALTGLTFDAIISEYCKRNLENNNWVGFTHCTVGLVKATANRAGIIYGPGTCCSYGPGSISGCAGWVVDDGTSAAHTGGSPSRVFLTGGWEIDGCQYGFYLNSISNFFFDDVRFIHRYGNTTLNPTKYWPETVADLASGASPAVKAVRGTLFFRVEAGGSLANVGNFINANASANIVEAVFDTNYVDNGSIGVTPAIFLSNPPNGTGTGQVKLNYLGVPKSDTSAAVAVRMHSTTASAISNSGFGVAGGKLPYTVIDYDRTSIADASNYWVTVPSTRLYRVTGKVCFAAASGTRVRLGIYADTAGVYSALSTATFYKPTANAETFTISDVVFLTAGQRVHLQADQNTGGAIALSTPISATADLSFTVEAV